MAAIDWSWHTFATLTNFELYAIVELRERVFVVEQHIVALDADGRDLNAHHLLGHDGETLVAYLRALPPEITGGHFSFGRVAVREDRRRQRLGTDLVRHGLEFLDARRGRTPIRISAQEYLARFYEGFGFRVMGDPYLEESVTHVSMRRV